MTYGFLRSSDALRHRRELEKQVRSMRRAGSAPAPHPSLSSVLPPEKMVALWNVDTGCRVDAFRIVDRQSVSVRLADLRFSAGAVSVGWMTEPFQTPLGLYARLATEYGFASREVQVRVLREFQSVSGQDWAGNWIVAGGSR